MNEKDGHGPEQEAQGIGGGMGEVPAWSRPDLVVEAPGGITAITPESTIAAAGNTLLAVAEQDIGVTAQRQHVVCVEQGIVLFTQGKAPQADRPVQDSGIKLHAAAGTVSVRAQDGAAQFNADRAVTISSTQGGIVIKAPKRLMFSGGGSALVMEDGNITLMTAGAARFGGAMKELAGPAPASDAVELPEPAPLNDCGRKLQAAAAAQEATITL